MLTCGGLAIRLLKLSGQTLAGDSFHIRSWAQCVMCFRSVAAQQAERSRILNKGILILLIPPFLILAAILTLAWCKSDKPPPQGGGSGNGL